jgi:hypothetical protein
MSGAGPVSEEYRRHHIHRRAFYSFVLVAIVLAVGTIGFHLIEHYSYVNSFYFASMLATAEGPATTPVTTLGKIFASAIAFVGVGSVVFALAYIFGPFIVRVGRISEQKLKRDEQLLSKDIRVYERRARLKRK